jgi:hypothetical protein
VYGNEVYGNTTGFLLDLLPGLQQKIARNYHVHDNNVHDNNHVNFGQANGLASAAPEGTGALVLASSYVDISKNTFTGNDGIPVLIVSYDIIDLLTGRTSTPDPKTNRYPDHIFVHDNTYSNNGGNPTGAYVLLASSDAGKKFLPYNVAWDGILDPKGYNDAGVSTDSAANICLGTIEQQSFVNFHGDKLSPPQFSTDPSAHKCTVTVPPLSP